MKVVRASETNAAGGPLFRFDPGWLFLISGAALLAATVLIPARNDLAQARWHRDRAEAVGRYRSERLEHYSEYLDALRRGDGPLVLSLAQTQLNLAPADRLTLVDLAQVDAGSASVFDGLEPVYVPAPEVAEPSSMLAKLATSERARLWLLAIGGMCLLVGLMPGSRAEIGVAVAEQHLGKAAKQQMG